MRTTVTLDPDVADAVRTLMVERRIGFKEAVNLAIRRGLAGPGRVNRRTRTFDMGDAAVPLDKALALAGELEDAELARRLEIGK